MSEIAIASSNSFDLAKYVLESASVTKEPVLFHILHIINISKSRLSQRDDWLEYSDPNSASVDRLNKLKKMVREVNIDDDGPIVSAFDVYKLLLQDSHKNVCYAFEKEPLRFLRDQRQSTGTPLPIRLGGKLLVKKDTPVWNGVLFLENRQCTYLGVDANDPLNAQLNTGLVEKYIAILDQELKS